MLRGTLAKYKGIHWNPKGYPLSRYKESNWNPKGHPLLIYKDVYFEVGKTCFSVLVIFRTLKIVFKGEQKCAKKRSSMIFNYLQNSKTRGTQPQK